MCVYTLEEVKQVNSFIHAISFTPHKQPLHKSCGYLLFIGKEIEVLRGQVQVT